MSRLLRWQFVVPRVLLVVVVLLAIQYVFCLWARSRTVRSLEAMVGAQADVAAARVSYVDGQVQLSGLRVANPRAPMRNLFEAERCDLVFETDAFLSRRVLVGQGDVAGLQFSTLRAASGAISGRPKLPAPSSRWLAEQDAQAVANWLTELNGQFGRLQTEDCESVRLTKELFAAWPARLAEIGRRARDLQARAADLRRRAAADRNPLRSDAFNADVAAELAALRQERAALAGDLEKLPESLDRGRRAIVAARRRDERLVCERLFVTAPAAEPLTAFLLREQVTAPVDEVLGWIHWSRIVLPADVESAARSGKAEPGLLLRNLALQGTAQLAGRTIELRGAAADLTLQPALLGRPMRLQLSATGPPALDVRATIDRSGSRAHDELTVDCGRLALPALDLGEQRSLRLAVAPTTAAMRISIWLAGDELTGEVRIEQSGVRIRPSIGADLEHVPLAAALDGALADVVSLSTRVSLGGTVDKPCCALSSDLGPAVAAALGRAVRRAAEERARQLLAEAQRQVDEQLAQVDRQTAEGQADLLPLLADFAVQLDELVARHASTQRLETEQLGRRLPAGSLFR